MDPYPDLPVIPGSASSGIPGPPMLRQPSYSGEDSTLASPGPSVELSALPERSKTGIEIQEAEHGVEDAGGMTKDVVDPVSPVAKGEELAAPGVTPAGEMRAASLSGMATGPESGGIEAGPDGDTVEIPIGTLSGAATAPPESGTTESGTQEGGSEENETKEGVPRGTSLAPPAGGRAGEEGPASPSHNDEIDAELNQPLPLGLNRYVLAALFAVVVLLKGCTYWGWNGFQDMFYKSGAYAWECRPGVAGYGQVIRIGGVDYEDCAPRKNSINNMYTVIFCTHFISSAFSGWVLDAAGPKICMLSAILVEVAGWLFFAFSSQAFRAYYVGAVLLGIAADPAYLPLLPVSCLFPGNESFIMSIMGSFRSISFAVPVVLSRIYLSESVPASSLWVVIVCYVGIGLGFCFIVTFLLVPTKAFKPLSEEAKERRKALRAAQKAAKKQRKSGGAAAAGHTPGAAASTARRPQPQGEEMPLREKRDSATSAAGKRFDEVSACSSSTHRRDEAPQVTFWDCLKSKQFLLILPCFLIALLRTEFYSKSNKEQLVVSTTGKDLYQMFSVVNILSFIPGPLMGKLADMYGIVFVLFLLNTCGIFVYVFLMPDEIICKGISICFYFFYCSFVLSNLYCYVAVNFPQQFFGKLTGLASLIGGIFSLTSLGWYKLSSETLFSWYPRNYLLVDGLMVALGLVNCFIIYGMYRTQRRKKPLVWRPKQKGAGDAAGMC